MALQQPTTTTPPDPWELVAPFFDQLNLQRADVNREVAEQVYQLFTSRLALAATDAERKRLRECYATVRLVLCDYARDASLPSL